MKRLLTTMLTLVMAITLHINIAFANNITVHPTEESIQQTVTEKQNRQALKQTWYGSRFYLDVTPKTAVDDNTYSQALQEVSYPMEGLDGYQVYVLPYTLEEYKNVLAYTFKDNSTVVFATMQLSTELTHWLAVHELGHAVDFKHMSPEKWAEYKKIRGIEDESKYNNNAAHKNQPREIFAEDFRILFGGAKAAAKAHENSSLQNPRNVEGLEEFFMSIL